MEPTPVVKYGRISDEELTALSVEGELLSTRPDPLLLLSLAIGALNLIGIGILLIRGG